MTGTAAAAVTAVVPTHNRPELMRAAVQSVVDQDYAGDIEVVVVFDACDVEVPDVTLRPGRTVRGIANGRTRGLAGARNSGILDAAHDYVAFLDDDDTWLPAKLTEQMAALDAAPDGSFLVATAMLVDDGTSTHTRLAPGDVVRHEDLVADRIAALHSSSFVFRRDRLIELGMIDEGLPASYGEDYDILLRASAAAPVVVVNRPLVSVRWTGHSYFYGRWRTYAEALKHLLSVHPELQGHRGNINRMRSQIAFALAASGQRSEARSMSRGVIRQRPTNLRAWLALAISFRLLSADLVARTANRFGKGI